MKEKVHFGSQNFELFFLFEQVDILSSKVITILIVLKQEAEAL